MRDLAAHLPKRDPLSNVALGIRAMPDDSLFQALRAIGCDLLACGACAELFFTGSRTHEHTCPKGR